jgi:hypothetical protein
MPRERVARFAVQTDEQNLDRLAAEIVNVR